MADNAERRPRQDTPKSRRVPKQNETYHACHKSRARKNRVCSWIDFTEGISPCYNIISQNSMLWSRRKQNHQFLLQKFPSGCTRACCELCRSLVKAGHDSQTLARGLPKKADEQANVVSAIENQYSWVLQLSQKTPRRLAKFKEAPAVPRAS